MSASPELPYCGCDSPAFCACDSRRYLTARVGPRVATRIRPGVVAQTATLSASHRAFVRRHAGAWYERAVWDWDEEGRDAFVAAVLGEAISDPSYDLSYPSFHRAWEAARAVKPVCMCPDDCGCHYPWRANVCGCKGHA